MASTRITRYMAITLVAFLAGCVPAAPTPAASPVPTSTRPPTATATSLPTLTPVPTATGTPTPVPTPEPTRGPIKPILLEYMLGGGDGGTSYVFFFGRDMPEMILYTDGQLLISGEHYGSRDWYVQKTLSTPEMCNLLARIRATGFFDVEGDGSHYPNDPIYQKPEYLGDGAGSYVLGANGKPSKWVYIYFRAVDNLVPQVKAAYQLFSTYRPSGMKAYAPDRVIMRIERQPGEDWHQPTPFPPQPWPPQLPSLAGLLGDQERQEVIFEGAAAAQALKLMQLPGSAVFTQHGQSYFLVGRPALPHETANYYSAWPQADPTVTLPFQCGK